MAEFFVETDNNTNITKYENVNPLCTNRLHCAIAVPKTEEELTLRMDIQDKNVFYNYHLGDIAKNVTLISVNQVIEIEDYAKLQFKGIEYTDDWLPSNTSGVYSHYEIDNLDEIYLVAKFDITNYQNSAKDTGTFVGEKALFEDKYSYTGIVIAEDADGKILRSYGDIKPLSTSHVYVLIEVPKVIMDKKMELTIAFNKQEYSYIKE